MPQMRFDQPCSQFCTESHIVFCGYSVGAFILSESSIRIFPPLASSSGFSLTCPVSSLWLACPVCGCLASEPSSAFSAGGCFLGPCLKDSAAQQCLPPPPGVIFDEGIRSSPPVWLWDCFSILSLWGFLRKRGEVDFSFSVVRPDLLSFLPPSSLTLSPGWWMALV